MAICKSSLSNINLVGQERCQGQFREGPGRMPRAEDGARMQLQYLSILNLLSSNPLLNMFTLDCASRLFVPCPSKLVLSSLMQPLGHFTCVAPFTEPSFELLLARSSMLYTMTALESMSLVALSVVLKIRRTSMVIDIPSTAASRQER